REVARPPPRRALALLRTFVGEALGTPTRSSSSPPTRLAAGHARVDPTPIGLGGGCLEVEPLHYSLSTLRRPSCQPNSLTQAAVCSCRRTSDGEKAGLRASTHTADGLGAATRIGARRHPRRCSVPRLSRR